MARTDDRFREAYNRLLDICAALAPAGALPSELALSGQLEVSRTVVRSALERLRAEGVIAWSGRDKRVLRRPAPGDRLQAQPQQTSASELERRFLDWILPVSYTHLTLPTICSV